ncbi:glutamine amidotransferase [Roseibium limicola]|uniref:Cytoplasmic protein n=1 Tax=Roseibium limicola TaxID=2816037 RepID=A0A939ER45_9HYPH|nr:glutamine amidotransferase [Roseibium limicola]MBO0345544.1 cytoplasmic protein [Roseibium limicola]
MKNKSKKILLVGESWVSSSTHFKGFDHFGSATFHSGATPFLKAMEGTEFEVTHMPAHDVPEAFPLTLKDLQQWDSIILSDIGSSSLLLHPDVWLHSKPVANRLTLLQDYVEQGGGLAMIGGYLTFQGIDGKGRWRNTPVEKTLPVRCHAFDDRIEVPEGTTVVLDQPDHPLLAGVPAQWPALLGLNEVVLAENAELVASAQTAQGTHPLLATTTYGKGRTLAWMSDMSPHWVPADFSDWPGYRQMWINFLTWLSND